MAALSKAFRNLYLGTLFDPFLPLPPPHTCKNGWRSCFSTRISQVMLHLPCALRRIRYRKLKRAQLPADIPKPVWPALCPQKRPRCLPLWLRSAVLGRSDARSSKGLDYHLPWMRERGVGSGTGKTRAATHLTPSSLAEPRFPSPGHALQPQQPICCPYASPCARRPPAPPAVLMRARLRTAQARVRRPLRVVPSSWRLRIPSLRAAYA